jgi:hypothetical protein
MDKMRARGKRWETVKGWTSFNALGMTSGKARGIHAYADLDGNNVLIAASASAVNAWMGGTRIDITPKWADVWLHNTSIRTISGTTATFKWFVYQPSTDTFTVAPHNLIVGDQITFGNVVSTGGTQLAGPYTVTAIVDIYQFTITVAAGTVPSSFPFTATVAFRNGLTDGTGDTPALRPRAWSISNFGENAVMCASDGTPVWVWQPAQTTPNIIVNGTFTAAQAPPWSGWAFSGGVAFYSSPGSPADLNYDVSNNVLEGGKTYEMSFQVVSVSGLDTFRVRIDTIDIWPRSITTAWSGNAGAARTYTFRFVCPANPLLLKFTVNIPTAGSISLDNVSIVQMPIASPINEAPQKNYALFVDGNGILSVLGSYEADGDFNPTLLRWCGVGNYRTWIPDSNNVAGELPLGIGSVAVCGAQVGARNLILTDDAAYAASFTNNGYTLSVIGTGCGAMSTNCLAVVNSRAYWPSKKSLCYYDGQQVTALECSIKTRFATKISQYQANKIFSWRNVEYNEIWMHYPHSDDGLEVSRYLILNLLDKENPWAFGTMNRTCMEKAGVFTNPIGFDVSGAVWYHDTGSDMPGGLVLPYLESGYITAEAGDQWVACKRYYPDIQDQIGNIRFTVTGKRAPQGQLNTQVIGPLVMVPNKRTVDFLISCRQMKFKWASEATPTNWRLGVVGLEMKPGEARR